MNRRTESSHHATTLRPERRRRPRSLRLGGLKGTLALALVATGVLIAPTSAVAASVGIVSSGPLTRVEISDELNCTVDHTGDSASEWYGQTACGTFLAVGDTVYGPSIVPAGPSSQSPWTPVSQSSVTGTGTQADPYRVTTVVAAGSTGVRLTETDTYVVGEESYRTDLAVSNTSGAAVSGNVYRAGDCFLQDSDSGFGRVEAASGAVACTASQAPGGRIEQMYPLTTGSHYYESFYGSIWQAVASGAPLPDTCDCDLDQDNGIGLSWPVALAAGGAKTYSSLVTFSPLGRTPLTIDATADAATVAPGAQDGYTVTVHNPNVTAVTLDALRDTLPDGFSYRAGTSTGASTADPTVVGQTLSWSGIVVPAGGTAALHFGVTVSMTPGTYTDASAGDASGYTVLGSGPTATITVTGDVPPNQAPVASDQSVTTQQGVAKAITLGATDADGNALTYAIVSGPSHGSLSGTGASQTYTPAAGYSGPDSFTFRANDGQADSNVATVSITVTPPAADKHRINGEGRLTRHHHKIARFDVDVSQLGSVLDGSARVRTRKGLFEGSRVTSLEVHGRTGECVVRGTFAGHRGYTLAVKAVDGRKDRVTLVVMHGSHEVLSVSGVVRHGRLHVS